MSKEMRSSLDSESKAVISSSRLRDIRIIHSGSRLQPRAIRRLHWRVFLDIRNSIPMFSINSSSLCQLTIQPHSTRPAFSLTLTQERLLIFRGLLSSTERDSFNTRRTRDSIKDGDGLSKVKAGFCKVSLTDRHLILPRRRRPMDQRLFNGIELEILTSNVHQYLQEQEFGKLNPFMPLDSS
jgi:hypothetical protein